MKAKTLAALLLVALIGAPSLWAQEELEIIDQNGDRVGNAQIELQVDDTGEEAPVAGKSAKIEGDRIIIIDQDGNKQEIDISSARGVSVQQSVQTINENGEQKTVRKSKAIIIKPNGERQVIELDGPIDGNDTPMPNMPVLHFEMLKDFGEMPHGLQIFGQGLPGSMRASLGKASKFMVGIHCEPVSDQLRAHLDLSDKVGLIVNAISPSSPAETAGIHKHDILLVADDKELTGIDVLGEVVELVGNEGSEVSLTAIRNGKEITFTLKPVERPANQRIEMGIPRFQFRQMGPGIIDNMEGEADDIQEQMQRMQQQFDQMKQRMDERAKQMLQDRDNN